VPEYGPALELDRTVTLRRLRTFKTVADLNSFSHAEQQLQISQPSVSYQVLKETRWLPRAGARGHLRSPTD